VTEGVVVALEAVEVEQHEHLGCAFGLAEILEQPPAVPQACEGVRQRLTPARPDQPQVVAEDEDQAEDQRADADRAESQGECVDTRTVVVDENSKARDAEERRRREELPALDPGAQACLGSPGGERQERQGEQPAHRRLAEPTQNQARRSGPRRARARTRAAARSRTAL